MDDNSVGHSLWRRVDSVGHSLWRRVDSVGHSLWRRVEELVRKTLILPIVLNVTVH
ncbi:MAG: hypothetical protein KDC80_02700 [Saprospiraceae bacterium]|nr:hypothetical protein [Saprospiraceae bacterium]